MTECTDGLTVALTQAELKILRAALHKLSTWSDGEADKLFGQRTSDASPLSRANNVRLVQLADIFRKRASDAREVLSKLNEVSK
jgi:hypothetical protein